MEHKYFKIKEMALIQMKNEQESWDIDRLSPNREFLQELILAA